MEAGDGDFKISLLTQNMNVHYFVPHSYNSRDSRVKTLISVIQDFDLVCLQEIFTFNLFGVGAELRSEIVNNWPYDAVLSKSAPFLQQDTGLMILSKNPVLEQKTIFYKDRNPKEIFSKKGALRAKIQLPRKLADGHDYFYVITTHLDAHVPEMRQKQLRQLVEEFVTPIANEKIVLVGDLNVDCIGLSALDEGMSEYSTLLETLHPLQDLRVLGSIKSEPTYQDGSLCIDYIFLLNMECDFESFTVQKNWKDSEGVRISDHNGLSVDLKF